MKLRRFTQAGLAQFTQYLDQLRASPTIPPPVLLLTDDVTSEPVADSEVTDQSFVTRFDAAKYLDGLLAAADLQQVERDVPLWAWLTLMFFNQVCPLREQGERKLGEQARYLLALDNFQRYYRHLLFGPYAIYRAHVDDPERARGVLMTKVSAPGDVVEQLASRQELITNKGIMGVATKLYFDKKKVGPKKGAGGKADGSPRRLADILNQFDLTFDLYSIPEIGIMSLLPMEFDRFR